MSILPFVFFGVLGLVCGSFGNVLLHRLRLQEPITGRSRCPHCHTNLRWFHLIPLGSFIALGGKCHACHRRISVRYPLVELGMAAVFIFILALSPDNIPLALLQGLALGSLMLAVVYDGLHQELPDVFTAAIGTLAIPIAVMRGDLGSSFIGALIPFVWFGGQWLVSRGRYVGTGDIFLGTVLGLWLGLRGSVMLLFLSYISGALIVLILLAFGLLPRNRERIPFGPFLAIGTLLTLAHVGEKYFVLLGW